MATIKYIKPEKYSGYIPANISQLLKTIKKRNFIILDQPIGGDAPKEFIKVYSFGQVKRRETSKWKKYIAKTGHKWYPNESITEHLLNSIGKELGLFMSNSQLAIISGQIRFLSEYFIHNEKQTLVHGVDIFANFISDRAFIEEIEEKKRAREFFTFQFCVEAIKTAFPDNYVAITQEFVKLLTFDAIVGNNDRHFYNWGVVQSITASQPPYFCPIFDTARGLFWNDDEAKIKRLIKEKERLNRYLTKYIHNSVPKIGWKEEDAINHITLIQKLRLYDQEYKAIINQLVSTEKETKVLQMVTTHFERLLSQNRLFVIKECLKMRFNLLRNL